MLLKAPDRFSDMLSLCEAIEFFGNRSNLCSLERGKFRNCPENHAGMAWRPLRPLFLKGLPHGGLESRLLPWPAEIILMEPKPTAQGEGWAKGKRRKTRAEEGDGEAHF